MGAVTGKATGIEVRVCFHDAVLAIITVALMEPATNQGMAEVGGSVKQLRSVLSAPESLMSAYLLCANPRNPSGIRHNGSRKQLGSMSLMDRCVASRRKISRMNR